MKKQLLVVLIAAMNIAAFSCTSCFLKQNAPANVFFYSNSVYSCDGSLQKVFDIPRTVKKVSFKSVAVTDFGISAWDADSQKLYMYSEKGKLLWSVALEAGQVWIKGNTILTRGNTASSESGNEGLSYSLYKIQKRKKLELLQRTNLDCFDSDVAFLDEGKVLLAGGNKINTIHSLYLFDEKQTVKRIATNIPKSSDFLHILVSDNKIHMFCSAREKQNANKNIYTISINSNGSFSALSSFDASSILPLDSLCFFGFGFEHGGNAVLPLVLGDKSIVFVAYRDGEIVKTSQGVVGCNRAFFASEDKSKFYYLAHDPLSDSSVPRLGVYSGTDRAELVDF